MMILKNMLERGKKMRVEFCSFRPMHDEIRENLDEAYNRVLNNSYYIQGKECDAFENEFAEYCNAKYCICFNN